VSATAACSQIVGDFTFVASSGASSTSGGGGLARRAADAEFDVRARAERVTGESPARAALRSGVPSRKHRIAARAALTLLAATSAGSLGGCMRSCRDTSKGEAIYQERCGLCHPRGSDDAQGPGLGGVVGRRAAESDRFSYSKALQASGLTWDRATLDRFLEDPSRLVPGTTMPLAVPDANERRELIAFLATLKRGASKHAGDGGGEVPVAAPGLRTGTAAFGGFREDGPGVERRFTAADLPAPFATPAARNAPKVVERPNGASPRVPPGFRAEVFAADLDGPRLIRVAPNGDVLVVESNRGRVRILRAKDGAPGPDRSEVFADELHRPFGVAFYPPGPDPRFLYVAETNAVVRFPYRSGDLRASGPPETVVAELAGSNGGHWTRDLAFSPDGRRMFVSVGSGSNVDEHAPKKSRDEIRAWEADHGLGADWGDEERRADVLVFDVAASVARAGAARIFATGIRNCVGLALQPATGDLWCSTNERDGLGDDLVPDYVTRVREGAFYGWPWFYLGDHPDPRHAGADGRPDLAGKITVPDVLLQAHSASLEMVFYEGSMFPASYRGQAFAALHGSWNRSRRTGYKVVRVAIDEKGAPTGAYEDFMTGFVVDDDRVWGRPVGVAVARDGALLVSEDGNGTLWRVSHAAP
jgi:glucose/arabinose dehydrogenase/cytochrome c2